MWCPDAALFEASWTALKQAGEQAVARGETAVDLTAWEHASSAHLAVILHWWHCARSVGQPLSVQGLNPTFKTLASLGGVDFIYTGASDAGH